MAMLVAYIRRIVSRALHDLTCHALTTATAQPSLVCFLCFKREPVQRASPCRLAPMVVLWSKGAAWNAEDDVAAAFQRVYGGLIGIEWQAALCATNDSDSK